MPPILLSICGIIFRPTCSTLGNKILDSLRKFSIKFEYHSLSHYSQFKVFLSFLSNSPCLLFVWKQTNKQTYSEEGKSAFVVEGMWSYVVY